jgi:MerR family transcriptional regulator, thiopeptide resistance regulator
MKSDGVYQVRQFAERAGVTVRALHYYDRLGLLRPSGRTPAGYRLYAESDLACLEQIVALKFIGFSLKQIRELLKRQPLDLPAELRRQRAIIEEKQRRLDLAIQAIERAERRVSSAGSRRAARRAEASVSRDDTWGAFRKIIEVINMQQNMDWAKKHYSEAAQAAIAERDKQWTPQMLEKSQQDWAELIRDVEAAVASREDPASAHAQALAIRWQALIGAFTGGNPEIQKGLNRLYADQQNWPSTFKKPYRDEAGAFICKALELRKQGPSK